MGAKKEAQVCTIRYSGSPQAPTQYGIPTLCVSSIVLDAGRLYISPLTLLVMLGRGGDSSSD